MRRAAQPLAASFVAQSEGDPVPGVFGRVLGGEAGHGGAHARDVALADRLHHRAHDLEHGRRLATACVDVTAERVLPAVLGSACVAGAARRDVALSFAGVAPRLHVDGRQLDANAVRALVGARGQPFRDDGRAGAVALRQKISLHIVAPPQ